MPIPLPIDPLVPEIVANLRRHAALVIEAAAGSGKTTRVPPALLELGGVILVLEPRRIAVRMAARRVASEMNQAPGETVGYQVRFEDVSSPRTRLSFVTEGVLTRRLLSDPNLRGVSAVVLDEFHERHLDTDLALALLRRLQKTSRPDLRLVLMSATLEAAPAAHFLGDCPVVRSEGRMFPIDIAHLPYSPAPLETQVADALERLLSEDTHGDILCFLPGSAEIRRAQRACEALARRHHLLLAPLFGDLTPEEQDRAIAPAAQRKVILATNIAESSITIEGVTAVIDSGLARIAKDSPWTGLPGLEVARISQSSAIQRAGRSGRTGPGRVLRLFTAEDYHRRPVHDTPEIARRELSQVCLQLEAMRLHPGELEWLEPPPAAAVQAAETLLDRLHARGEHAVRLARLPLHPRLARLVTEGIARGAGYDACAIAAILSAGERPRSADILRSLDEPAIARSTQQAVQQIRRVARPPQPAPYPESELGCAILSAFPDRVARKRPGDQYLLAGNRTATARENLGAFIVAVDVEERSEHALPLIRLACPIQPDWLLDLFPDAVTERKTVEWNRAAERVEQVNALIYDGLVIDENRAGRVDSEEASRLLADKVFESGIGRFVDQAELDELLARVEFASQSSDLVPLHDEQVREAFARILNGLSSFAQVREAAPGLLKALENSLDRATLDRIAPARLRLPGGRQTRIHYETGKTPWAASRLQDFFGLRESPRIANGKVPLVLHLLAPNQRPVQTTTDLAGFWERLYPQLRRELGRRYPKHAWPENPL